MLKSPPNASVGGHVPTVGRRFDTFSKQHREQLAMGGVFVASGSGTGRKTKAKARIRVVVRKRPLSDDEKIRHESDILALSNDYSTIQVNEPRKNVCGLPYTESHEFVFDRAYAEHHTNLDVYTSCVRDLVDSVFQQGARCACFAYGQTGSGKTYTMVGTGKIAAEQKTSTTTISPDPGLLELTANVCFEWLQKPEFEYHLGLYVSFFEIYCNKVYDLLNGRRLVKALETNNAGAVVVKDLRTLKVENVESLLQTIGAGLDQRIVGINSKNNDSSRGHAILTLEVRNEHTGSNMGKLVFVDLAGSERGVDAMGSGKQTQTDGAGINRSLLALKECIRALGQQSSHVPFRDSELTKVLRDMFMGSKTKTLMISCVSPSAACCEQTLNTLRYADRVKTIRRSGRPEVDTPPPLTARAVLDTCVGSARELLSSSRHVYDGNVPAPRCFSAGTANDTTGADSSDPALYSDELDSERRKTSAFSLGTSHDSLPSRTAARSPNVKRTQRKTAAAESLSKRILPSNSWTAEKRFSYQTNRATKLQRNSHTWHGPKQTDTEESTATLEACVSPRVTQTVLKLQRKSRFTIQGEGKRFGSKTIARSGPSFRDTGPRFSTIPEVNSLSASCYLPQKTLLNDDDDKDSPRPRNSARPLSSSAESLSFGEYVSVPDTCRRANSGHILSSFGTLPERSGFTQKPSTGRSSLVGKRVSSSGNALASRLQRYAVNTEASSPLQTSTSSVHRHVPKTTAGSLRDASRGISRVGKKDWSCSASPALQPARSPLLLNHSTHRESGNFDVSKFFPKKENDDTLAAAGLLRKRYKDLNFPLLPESRGTGKHLELDTAVKMIRGLSELPAHEILKFYDRYQEKLHRFYSELVNFHTECVKGHTNLGITQQQMLKNLQNGQHDKSYELNMEYLATLRKTIESELSMYIRLGKRVSEMEKMLSLQQTIFSGYQAASASEVEFYGSNNPSSGGGVRQDLATRTGMSNVPTCSSPAAIGVVEFSTVSSSRTQQVQSYRTTCSSPTIFHPSSSCTSRTGSLSTASCVMDGIIMDSGYGKATQRQTIPFSPPRAATTTTTATSDTLQWSKPLVPPVALSLDSSKHVNVPDGRNMTLSTETTATDTDTSRLPPANKAENDNKNLQKDIPIVTDTVPTGANGRSRNSVSNVRSLLSQLAEAITTPQSTNGLQNHRVRGGTAK